VIASPAFTVAVALFASVSTGVWTVVVAVSVLLLVSSSGWSRKSLPLAVAEFVSTVRSAVRQGMTYVKVSVRVPPAAISGRLRESTGYPARSQWRMSVQARKCGRSLRLGSRAPYAL